MKSSAVIIAIVFSACAGERASSNKSSVAIDTLANGAVRTRNGAEIAPTDWTVAEVVRIGAAESDGPETFGSIWDVTTDALDRVYVLDNLAKEIRVFDVRGTHVRTLGRQGNGPGELANPIGLGWDRHGRLWVVDPGNSRYSVFDTAGAYITSYTRKVSGWGIPWSGGFDRSGNLHEMDFVTVPGSSTSKNVLVRSAVGTEIVPLDTFDVPQREEEFFRLKRPDGEMIMSIPFVPMLHWIFDGHEGLFTGATDEYNIAHQRLTGDTVRVIEKALAAIPVSDADIEKELESRTQLDSIRRTELRRRIPKTKPAFERLIVDDAGRLWVLRTETSEEQAAAGRPLDVFDAQGVYMGTVMADLESFPPPRVLRNRIVGVTRDDLDVPYVVVYSITQPPRDRRN